MVLVPILSKPLLGDSAKKRCPGCRIYHGCKTVHLVVNDSGLVLVSEGVLEDLRLAGLEANSLEIVAEERNPPPLRIDGRSTLSFADQRKKQDQEAQRIVVRR